MKKRTIFLVIISIIVFIVIGYISINAPVHVKTGTYYMETGDNTGVPPFVSIYKNQISFTYDLLSSHITIGSYSIKKNLLTMTTYDKKESYVFRIDGDNLYFQEHSSSPINRKDKAFGSKILDNAKFHLDDNNNSFGDSTASKADQK